MNQRLSVSRRLYDVVARILLYLCAGLTCALLVFLIGEWNKITDLCKNALAIIKKLR